jgi:hypothetical protein
MGVTIRGEIEDSPWPARDRLGWPLSIAAR